MKEEKRTKLVDKKVYVKWYNLAKEAIQNAMLIPARSDKEIFSIVSRKNWLMFVNKGEDKEIAINSKDPNIFLAILSKEGNLTGEARLGLTFNNLKAYEKFKIIMHGYNQDIKKRVVEKLLRLENDWKISIERKVKEYNYAQSPEYFDIKIWNSNKINDKIIDEIVEIANNIRESGIKTRDERRAKNRFYSETPNINLMESTFKLTEEEFKKRILEVFEVLSLCLNVKTDIEIRKIIRDKQKILQEKEKELANEREHKKQLEFLETFKKADKEKIKESQNKIESLEKEINNLKKEIK